MREIKFRALIEYGDTTRHWEFYSTFDQPIWIDDCANYKIIVHDLQYTGLKDKNGKEIYEGDIVRNHWTRCDGADLGSKWVVKFGEYDNSDIEYGSPALGFYGECNGRQEGINNLPTDTYMCIEVIGNIYENPELPK